MPKPDYILALDTSGKRCDVALCGKGLPAAQRTSIDPYGHSEKILPLIDEVLAERHVRASDISVIAISIGPGSFTGLRVGLSAVKGLAYSLDIPVVAVPTHDVIFHAIDRPDRAVWITNTARKEHFYVTRYFPGRHPEPPVVTSVRELCAELSIPITIATDHPDWIRQTLPEDRLKFVDILDDTLAYPDACVVAGLARIRHEKGEYDPMDSLIPLYVQPFQGVM